MNLLGKIFVVLIFVMSILFMAFAVCVYATHRNYADLAKDVQTKLNEASGENRALIAEKERNQNVLDFERAARTSAITSLNGRLVQSETQAAQIRQQVAQLEDQRRSNLAAVTTAQNVLKTLKDDNSRLQQQVSDTRAAADKRLKEAIAKTDQLNQLKAELERLKRRNDQQLEQIARAKIQLRRFNLELDDPLIDIPPSLEGEVERVSRDRKVIQVSIGRDDGLQLKHELNFYRRDQYLGRGEVFKVEPEYAIVRVKSLQGRDIRSGDSAKTRVE